MKWTEIATINNNYKKIWNTDKEEFYCDYLWKAKCVYYKDWKKMVEDYNWNKYSIKNYEYIFWKKKEDTRLKMGEWISKFDDEMKAKLFYIYSLWANETEKANFLGVWRKTLYNWKKKYPEFFESLEMLDTDLTIKARENLKYWLEQKDMDITKWVLERKLPKEFWKNVNIDVNTNVRHVVEWNLEKLKDVSEEEKNNIIMWIIQEPESIDFKE